MKVLIMRFFTQPVRKHLQPLNPVIFVELQTVNAVETVVLDQIERRVHGHLRDKETFLTSLLSGRLFLTGQ